MSYAWYRAEVGSLEELRREAAAAAGGADDGLRPGEALHIVCQFPLAYDADPLEGVLPPGPEWQTAVRSCGGRAVAWRIWRVRA